MTLDERIEAADKQAKWSREMANNSSTDEFNNAIDVRCEHIAAGVQYGWQALVYSIAQRILETIK